MMAIFMLLLLAGLAMITMKYVRIHARHFVDSYNKEQAQLFMQSVIESALMQIEGTRRNGGCIQNLDYIAPDGKFEANVSIEKYFIYKPSKNDIASCPILQEIQTPQSNGYILMRVVVESRKGAKVLSPIRITKRTLQRP